MSFPLIPSVDIGNGIRRSPLFKDELLSLPYPEEPHVNTSFHCLKRSATIFKDNEFLASREKLPDNTRGNFIWRTYATSFSDSVKYGLGLKALCGLQSGKTGHDQTRVGIYTMNRPEATECLFAIWSRRAVAVPLYDSLIPNAVAYIVDHAELSVVMVEASKLANLIKGKGTKGTLKHVVLLDEASDADRAACAAAGLSFHTLKELAKAAEGLGEAGADGVEPVPDDWSYVMYTSGTTGDPKGVILTHRNILASAAGLCKGSLPDASIFIRPDDRYISYLPMAHTFEVCMQLCIIIAGAGIGFFQGDVKKLVSEDMPLLKPTLMAGVPRVYSRIYDKVMQGIAKKGRVAKLLFDVAYANQSWCKRVLGMRNPVWDWILFNTVRQAVGGKMRIMASGAAPLSADLHKFLRVVFGCEVCQGYGMTENAAAAAAQAINYPGAGNIGGPIPSTEIKLVDTDDYKSADVYPATAAEFEKQVSFKGEFQPKLAGKVVERGEVCLRGPNIFQGYFKMEQETKEALDADGWLHTGDIGTWDPDGALRIVDRKKNIFKLAQGEYVSPESVEAAAGVSKWICQVWVYGSSFETCVVAVVVPDMEVLTPYIASKGLSGSVDEICAMPEVKAMIYDDMVACCRAAKLRSFEIPKDIAFVTEVNELGQGFTIESDCLTPTMKLRRPQLQKKYQALVDKCYAQVKANELASGGGKD